MCAKPTSTHAPNRHQTLRENDINPCAKTTEKIAQTVCIDDVLRYVLTVSRYLERLVDPWLTEVLAVAPAVMLTGARASGKTTTAMRHAASVVHLDRPNVTAPFEADPDAALRGRSEPVLLDEWQACPGVVGAVKRAIDTDRRPGRFILTGSVRSDTAPVLWPGTGRLIRMPMYPLTVREQQSKPHRHFASRTLAGEHPDSPFEELDLRDYVEIALRGGFPEPALELAGSVREDWFRSYSDQLLSLDLSDNRSKLNGAGLAAFLEAYALNSAGVVNDITLYEAAGLDRRTARVHTTALSDVGVIAELPAWSTNRLKRLARGPKRHITDTGLWAALVGADLDLVMSDGNLLGRLLDTFVTNQLRAEAAVDPVRPRLYHLRDRDGRHEVDLILDLGARGIIGVEIKANSAPRASHARHLAWLRDRLGDRFKAGVLFHTGPVPFTLGERIEAVPISALWN